MTGNELRRKYIEFFKGKGHAEISGRSLIPENDVPGPEPEWMAGHSIHH